MSDESKMATAGQFKKIRESTGMNRKDFAEYLNIPYRTMQEWELGRRTMPEYVMELVDFKVKHDPTLIKEQEKKESVVGKIHDKQKILSSERPAAKIKSAAKEERE